MGRSDWNVCLLTQFHQQFRWTLKILSEMSKSLFFLILKAYHFMQHHKQYGSHGIFLLSHKLFQNTNLQVGNCSLNFYLMFCVSLMPSLKPLSTKTTCCSIENIFKFYDTLTETRRHWPTQIAGFGEFGCGMWLNVVWGSGGGATLLSLVTKPSIPYSVKLWSWCKQIHVILVICDWLNNKQGGAGNLWFIRANLSAAIQ